MESDADVLAARLSLADELGVAPEIAMQYPADLDVYAWGGPRSPLDGGPACGPPS